MNVNAKIIRQWTKYNKKKLAIHPISKHNIFIEKTTQRKQNHVLSFAITNYFPIIRKLLLFLTEEFMVACYPRLELQNFECDNKLISLDFSITKNRLNVIS